MALVNLSSYTVNGSLLVGKLIGLTQEYDNGNSSTAITIDWSANGAIQKVTLTGTATLTFTAPGVDGVYRLQLRMIQDATGGRFPVYPVITWAGGSAPVINSTPLRFSILNLIANRVSGTTTYYGSMVNY